MGRSVQPQSGKCRRDCQIMIFEMRNCHLAVAVRHDIGIINATKHTPWCADDRPRNISHTSDFEVTVQSDVLRTESVQVVHTTWDSTGTNSPVYYNRREACHGRGRESLRPCCNVIARRQQESYVMIGCMLSNMLILVHIYFVSCQSARK